METWGCLQIFKLTTKFVSLIALQPKHMNTHSKCYCIPFATSYTGCLRFTTNQLLIPHTHTQATFRDKELTFCCVFWFGCCWTVCGKLTVGFCTVFGSCTVCTCPLFGIVPPVPVGRFQLTPVLAFVRNEKVFLVPPVLNVCWKTWRSILSDYVLLLHIR